MTAPEDQKEVIHHDFERHDSNAAARDALQNAVRVFVAGDLAGKEEGVYSRLLAAIEEPLLRETLRLTYGNQIRAARILGLNRNTLRKKMLELAIKPRGRRERSSS